MRMASGSAHGRNDEPLTTLSLHHSRSGVKRMISTSCALPLDVHRRLNALGEPLPTKGSSLKSSSRTCRILSDRDDHKFTLPDRKIQIEPLEWFVCNSLSYMFCI